MGRQALHCVCDVCRANSPLPCCDYARLLQSEAIQQPWTFIHREPLNVGEKFQTSLNIKQARDMSRMLVFAAVFENIAKAAIIRHGFRE